VVAVRANDLGPVLSDGTRVADLLDMERLEIGTRVLADPEIYRLELDRLFAKTWQLVAHVSELPRPGDYVVRYIGEDQVIVVRDSQGEFQVLLNVCQHRGMTVCRAEAGNASTFKCPYHGWAYSAEDGSFVGAPVPEERTWGDIVPRSEIGLPRARVDTCAGFIFATLDHDNQSLDEFLGDYKWYFQTYYDRTPGGMEVVGSPQRFTVRGNWKLGAEQFVGGDGYHVMTLHRALYQTGVLGSLERRDDLASGYGCDVSFRQGHSVRASDRRQMEQRMGLSSPGDAPLAPLEQLKKMAPTGMTPEMVDSMVGHLDDEQIRLLADYPPSVGGCFPNVATFQFPLLSAEGPLAGVHGIHLFQPKGPEEMEWWHFTLVEKDAPEDFKEAVARTTTQTVGSTAMIEQDDGYCWPEMTRAARGAWGRQQTIKYQAQLGVHKPDDWPGGGIVSYGFTKDDGQWHWWRAYFEHLTGVYR
jgi:phenylpropionate dioxygenase-like ring-hydroxylating dioxygenase large terminal subunit